MPAAGRDVIAEFRAGNVRGLARAITVVERGGPTALRLVEELAGRAARPAVLGVTGAPGTGKSTLVDGLIGRLRAAGSAVAVLAVDPNSPFTGGAILGDRIRMQRHALDTGVYIRSLGARGHLGGLSAAARQAVRLLGAFGFDEVMLETVGVGQSELEVAAVADTTALVLAPGMGDGVQMIKAGIMEIADVFVVNKADLPGADQTVRELRSMLSFSPHDGWTPPIVRTSSMRGDGLEELLAAVRSHRRHLEESGAGAVRAERRLKDEAAELVGERARAEARRRLESEPGLLDLLRQTGTPYAVADAILSSRPASSEPAGPDREGAGR